MSEDSSVVMPGATPGTVMTDTACWRTKAFWIKAPKVYICCQVLTTWQKYLCCWCEACHWWRLYIFCLWLHAEHTADSSLLCHCQASCDTRQFTTAAEQGSNNSSSFDLQVPVYQRLCVAVCLMQSSHLNSSNHLEMSESADKQN